MKNILVTGCAGFIGTNLIKKLLKNEDYFIVGIDNLNPYYDVRIKDNNLKLNNNKRFEFVFADITDEWMLNSRVFDKYKFDYVIHLAAQAGVGYSIEHPLDVVDVTNVISVIFPLLIFFLYKFNFVSLILVSFTSLIPL